MSNDEGRAGRGGVLTEDVPDEGDVVGRRHGPGASERAAARGEQPLERRWRGRRVHLHAPPHAHAAAPAPARCIPPPPLDRGRGAAAPFHRRLHQHVRTYKPPADSS